MRLKFILSLIAICLIKGKISSQENTFYMTSFFKDPQNYRFKLSPSGSYLAWICFSKNQENLCIKSIKDKKITKVKNIFKGRGIDFFWIDDTYLIYNKNTKNRSFIYLIDRKGKKHKKLISSKKNKRAYIIDPPYESPFMLIGLDKRTPNLFDVYRLNIKTGKMHLVYKNPGNIIEFKANHRSELVLAVSIDKAKTTLLYRENEAVDFTKVVDLNSRDILVPLFFDSQQENRIYAFSNLGKDKKILIQYDLKEKKEVQEIFKDPQGQIGVFSYLMKENLPIMISYYRDKKNIRLIDKSLEKIYDEWIKHVGEDKEIELVSINKEKNKFIIKASSDRQAAVYYFHDALSFSFFKIAEAYANFKQEDLSKMIPVQYKSRKGDPIKAYLSLPLNKSIRGLPIIVYVDDFLEGRNYWEFNPEIQFLTKKGYGVFQVNFPFYRHKVKDKEELKKRINKVQEDIIDGLNWLIRRNIADPSRIGILGRGPYGGAIAYIAAIKGADMYSAIVSYEKDVNWNDFYLGQEEFYRRKEKMIYDHSISLNEFISIFDANEIKTPCFIIKEKPNLLYRNIIKLLGSKKIESIYIESDPFKEKEDKNQVNKIFFYEKIERFFFKHLQNKKEKKHVFSLLK